MEQYPSEYTVYNGDGRKRKKNSDDLISRKIQVRLHFISNTDIYLHHDSNHYPSQKEGLISNGYTNTITNGGNIKMTQS